MECKMLSNREHDLP